MKVQTTQLEALRWIARLGSFRAAAARLNVSQPTISVRIRELERLLGTKLFDRSGQRAVITEAGRELARYAERIVALAEAMELHSSGSLVTETLLRMGSADTFALTCLPLLLAQLEQSFPALRVDLQVDFSSNLNQRLQKGELDIAFMTGPVDETGMLVEPLVRLPLAWVASPRLAIPSRVLLPRDLVGMATITNPEPSHLFRTVHAWFAAGECQPERIITCNSLTIMARLAVAGYGITMLPTAILRAELELGGLKILRTDPPIGAHDLLMVTRYTVSPVVVRAVRDLALQLVSSSEMSSA